MCSQVSVELGECGADHSTVRHPTLQLLTQPCMPQEACAPTHLWGACPEGSRFSGLSSLLATDTKKAMTASGGRQRVCGGGVRKQTQKRKAAPSGRRPLKVPNPQTRHASRLPLMEQECTQEERSAVSSCCPRTHGQQRGEHRDAHCH